MQLFYDPDINGQTYTLREEDSKHAVRVLRKTVGDEVNVVNGRGQWFQCTIQEAHQKHCEVSIDQVKEGEWSPTPRLHIAVAPTKNNDRLEWFLEKSTELGIAAITPLLCAHSERKVVKLERLKKVQIAAMKQSLKAWLPDLSNLTKFKEFVTSDQTNTFGTQRFIAHCEDGAKTPLHQCYVPGDSALILIGPEGDFSPAEIELAVQHGFQPISLGENRLRTETAALAACHTFNLLNDMQ